MIQLHYAPSNASITPHILLEEMGLPFELKQVDRPTTRTSPQIPQAQSKWPDSGAGR